MSHQRAVSPAATPADTPLTILQAAEYLNVSERFMRRLVAERRVAYHKVGKLLRFRSQDLDDFLESGRVEPPRQALPKTRRPWQSV